MIGLLFVGIVRRDLERNRNAKNVVHYKTLVYLKVESYTSGASIMCLLVAAGELW
jgi:hypothetical protein